jgi:hypothetical protein
VRIDLVLVLLLRQAIVVLLWLVDGRAGLRSLLMMLPMCA